MSTFLWVIVPYICLAIFVVGHWWRYRYDKFGWTTRSSQLYESKMLQIASPRPAPPLRPNTTQISAWSAASSPRRWCGWTSKATASRAKAATWKGSAACATSSRRRTVR